MKPEHKRSDQGTTLFDYGQQVHFIRQTKGVFGIEIETETKNASGYPDGILCESFRQCMENGGGSSPRYEVNGSSFWEVCRDGSLRNYGVEWVTSGVLDYDEAVDALNEFAGFAERINFLPTPPGCSVHVHLNMQPLTMVQVANFMALWVMFENILVDYCGDTRRSNLFALPCRVAEPNVENIVEFCRRGATSDPKALTFTSANVKYAAMNLGRLRDLGSLEIRPMRGTTDVSILKAWITMLWKMYNYAQTIDNPRVLLNAFQGPSLYNVKKTFHEIFGALADDLLNFSSNGFDASVMRNLFYIYEIAGCLTPNDWQSFKTVPTIQQASAAKSSRGVVSEGIDEASVFQPWPTPSPSWITEDEIDDYDD